MRPDLDKRISDVGSFIRDQRNMAEMSVRKLADLAGVSNPYLSQIERGLRKPSAEILQQLAKALRISAETMYQRAGMLDSDITASTHASPLDARGTKKDVPGTKNAIMDDAALNDEQRRALIRIYDSFCAENSSSK